MFKNFLDKAKSAIDEMDQKLQTATKDLQKKKPAEYDASYFTFTLEGGPLHSSRLTAVARVKAGIF